MMNGHGVPEDSYAPDAKDVEIAELEAEIERLRRTVGKREGTICEYMREVERLKTLGRKLFDKAWDLDQHPEYSKDKIYEEAFHTLK